MKKVIAVVTLLSLAVAFSSVVFAAGDGYYNYHTTKNATRTVNNVTVTVIGVEFSLPSNQYTFQQGIYQYYSDLQVAYTVHIVNNNSTTMYIDSLWFRPTFDESTYSASVTNIDNFSTDLIGTIDSTNGGIGLTPSTDWSFLNNICIPANTSISAVFTISMRAYAYSTSSTISSWFNPELTSMYVSFFNAYDTDFTPQGAHDDLLISLEALRNFLIGNTGVPAINTALNSIVTELTVIDSHIDDIERLLTWVGQYNAAGFGAKTNATVTGTNYTVIVRNFGSRPITDFEVLPPNTVISDIMYVHPIQIEIETNFTEDQSLTRFVVEEFMSAGSSNFDNPIIYSDDIVVVGVGTTNGNYSAYVRYSDNIIPKGHQFNSIWLYVYSRSNYLPVNSSFTVSLTTADYQSDLSQESESLKNQTDAVHTQEEAFFQQNNDAIAQTGLSNYRFGTTTSNGLSAVSNDFVSVWNALGSWTIVYIFSLVLTVALTIIRYAPNAIRARSYRRNSGGH